MNMPYELKESIGKAIYREIYRESTKLDLLRPSKMHQKKDSLEASPFRNNLKKKQLSHLMGQRLGTHGDFILYFHQTRQNGLGGWWTTGNITINGNDLIDAL